MSGSPYTMSRQHWQTSRAVSLSATSAAGPSVGASQQNTSHSIANGLGATRLKMSNGSVSRPFLATPMEPTPSTAPPTWSGNIWGSPTLRGGLQNPNKDSVRGREENGYSDMDIAPSLALTGSGSLLPSSESDDWESRRPRGWQSRSSQSPAVFEPHQDKSASALLRTAGSSQLSSLPVFKATQQKPPRPISPSFGKVVTPFPRDLGEHVAITANVPSSSRVHYPAPASNSAVSDFGGRSTTGQLSGNAKSFHTPKVHDGTREMNGYSRLAHSPPPLRTVGSFYRNVHQNEPIANQQASLNMNATLLPGDAAIQNGLLHCTASTADTIGSQSFLPPFPLAGCERPELQADSYFASRAAPRAYGELFEESRSVDMAPAVAPLPPQAHALYNSQMPSPSPHLVSTGVPRFLSNAQNDDDQARHLTPWSVTPSWGMTESDRSQAVGIFTPDSIADLHISEQPPSHDLRKASERSQLLLGSGHLQRNQQSPFISTGGTPTIEPDQFRQPLRRGLPGHGGSRDVQTALLDRKLRGLQQEQQSYVHPTMNIVLPGTELYKAQPSPPPYTFGIHGRSGLHTVAPYLPNYLAWPAGSLPPHSALRENDAAAHLKRSPLLEEFRSNTKTSKQYELRDIYNHIVEFSGDQHGSRFIQQKLETASSDEKEQLFTEIKPNSLQLMTDVFGNYVIQKFFEHGTQQQKMALADQMKGHIVNLSLQMYGCRVVQKALEHVLVDQQAALVREIDSHVLKCVKDQNGNHVIQKAIERVPLPHIQFIIDAFVGQAHSLATHPYGCRVIQRMLEHCGDTAQKIILKELFASGPSLVQDQYGNYVTQHIIAHGKDEDRARIINLVTTHLVQYSRHKYASNVVEKSIEFGTDQQRQEFLTICTTAPPGGMSPLFSLMRDQYGNYVIQRLLSQLKGADYDRLVEEIKPQLATLKKSSHGKQITAIEKLIQGPLSPCGSAESRSPLPPATNLVHPLPTPSSSPLSCNAIGV